MKPLIKISCQTTTKLLFLFFVPFLFSLQNCVQKKESKTEQTKKVGTSDYSQVDYSKASNIIKNPKKLTGDEKVIFYHPFFLKLTYEETKKLEPIKIKKEFAKLGITTDQHTRFAEAHSFFIMYYQAHKKSCEQRESFKNLTPQSKH